MTQSLKKLNDRESLKRNVESVGNNLSSALTEYEREKAKLPPKKEAVDKSIQDISQWATSNKAKIKSANDPSTKIVISAFENDILPQYLMSVRAYDSVTEGMQWQFKKVQEQQGKYDEAIRKYIEAGGAISTPIQAPKNNDNSPAPKLQIKMPATKIKLFSQEAQAYFTPE